MFPVRNRKFRHENAPKVSMMHEYTANEKNVHMISEYILFALNIHHFLYTPVAVELISLALLAMNATN